jgi:Putative peptidoglycan binding domain
LGSAAVPDEEIAGENTRRALSRSGVLNQWNPRACQIARPNEGRLNLVPAKRERMANPGQPTISPVTTGDAVKRLERALRRTPNPGLTVDGVFGPKVETTIKQFQQDAGLTVDGIVGPVTWAALPDGGPMPTLQEGSTGSVVNSFQTLLTNGAPGQWNRKPQGIDGNFGPHMKASVAAFQAWGRRRAGRDCRPPDLGCFLACGERHAGNSGRLCSSLSVHPTLRTGLKQVRRGGRLYNPRLCCGAAR